MTTLPMKRNPLIDTTVVVLVAESPRQMLHIGGIDIIEHALAYQFRLAADAADFALLDQG